MKMLGHTLVVLAALGSLAACGMTESHESKYAGTPTEWWSDGYMTMVQDMNSDGQSAAKKPTRIRLF